LEELVAEMVQTALNKVLQKDSNQQNS